MLMTTLTVITCSMMIFFVFLLANYHLLYGVAALSAYVVTSIYFYR